MEKIENLAQLYNSPIFRARLLPWLQEDKQNVVKFIHTIKGFVGVIQEKDEHVSIDDTINDVYINSVFIKDSNHVESCMICGHSKQQGWSITNNFTLDKHFFCLSCGVYN